jgi:outer membrane phospholipase A
VCLASGVAKGNSMTQLEEGIKHVSNDQKISDEQLVNIWSAVVHCLMADQKDLLVEGLHSLLRRSWLSWRQTKASCPLARSKLP